MKPDVQKAFEAADSYVSSIAKKSAEFKRPVPCKKGCFHCCKEPVYATKDEAELLVDRLTEAEKDALRIRVAAWLKRFLDAHLDELDPEPGAGYGNLLKYRGENLYCPLLIEGACSAYFNRPIGCRLFLVSGPVSRCKEDALRPTQVFVKTKEEPEFLRKLVSIQYLDTLPFLVETDHLGVWLSHILNGEKLRTAAGSDTFLHD